ncbi:hypothetical protein ABEB36_000911 [Hypothenemus hampei]|uniref:NF-X1-type zinc finger protein NFXL1 n=1 Tax=Hypothenemus hampei TaxID=57062 RepID=A0ABD1FEP9_HYPHA
MNKLKTNPWSNNRVTKPKKTTSDFGPALGASSESKFKEIQAKHHKTIQKHVENYESSSEEEDLDTVNLLDSILKDYNTKGGTSDQLIRTKTFIEDSFISGASTCLICISRIKRDDQIWSCHDCYGVFHLTCIQRWSKDTVMQQKHRIEEQMSSTNTLSWCCPKCRFKYLPQEYPTKYQCFCGKVENPRYEPFLVPHSCGEICHKNLKPLCGHKCLLLCHPGPCPPCPVTVTVSCYCGCQKPTLRRCCYKGWSCGNKCNKLLSCNKHKCNAECHSGDCPPCEKKRIQKCLCLSKQALRECASPQWQCETVCLKPLDCGNHKCQVVCHEGACESCPLKKQRFCPCGKNSFILPCTEATPTCGLTCDKLLDCQLHNCNSRCHKDKCGLCLEVVEKSCRCGQHSKEIQCCKQYLCETKCKKIKDCGKHPCNRKCCDGNCPPCEKPCGNTLQCGNHKCSSVCHRGPCYPCQQTKQISCRCTFTKITVPCGRRHKIKPPKCQQLCLLPPDCDHDMRTDNHKCHFGDCPPCKQICLKEQACGHHCRAICHSAVLVKVQGPKPNMPWEQNAPVVEKQAQPCPDCKIPVTVTCFGGHETAAWPCYMAKPSSCGRSCGRLLPCTNHKCSLACHVVDGAINELQAGSNCEQCENPCMKSRPENCTHLCPNPCHAGDCPLCKQILRIKCHCGISQLYVQCYQWLDVAKRDELQCCGNQCPKNYGCGHRCKANCHPGDCPLADLCKKKIKITCKCRRLKKEFQCETVRKGLAIIECDEVCLEIQMEEEKKKVIEDELRRKEEMARMQKELEMFEKKFSGKKKNREKKVYSESTDDGFLRKYWIYLLAVFILIVSFMVYYLLNL